MLQVRGYAARPVHVRKVQFATVLERALAQLQHGQFVRAQIQHAIAAAVSVNGVLKQGASSSSSTRCCLASGGGARRCLRRGAAADLLVNAMVLVYCCCCCVTLLSSSSCSPCSIVALALISRHRCCCRRCCCRRCCRSCCCRRRNCLLRYSIDVARVVSRTGSLAYPFLSGYIRIEIISIGYRRIRGNLYPRIGYIRIYPFIRG